MKGREDLYECIIKEMLETKSRNGIRGEIHSRRVLWSGATNIQVLAQLEIGEINI